jgi:6-phosphogluconolactonase (cycloisomerase 2 family)
MRARQTFSSPVVVVGFCFLLLAALPSGGPQLAFLESEVDGAAGVDGLSNIVHVTVSPDGKHVYAIGQADASLVWFSCESETGGLTFGGAKFDGVNGVEGLDGARWAAVSPDGRHIYTTAVNDDAVALFSRNATTGEPTFLGATVDGHDGVTGLDFVSSIAVSPDGQLVIASGTDSLVLFRRQATTGRLYLLEALIEGPAGATVPLGFGEMMVSPDGKHLYATVSGEDAVAAFLISYFGTLRANSP